MKREEVIAKLFPRIEESIGRTPVKIDSRLVEDLGWDELDHVEAEMIVEAEFNLLVPDDTFYRMTTMAEIVDWVVTKFEKGAAAR